MEIDQSLVLMVTMKDADSCAKDEKMTTIIQSAQNIFVSKSFASGTC
jgi:hypothetical protein